MKARFSLFVVLTIISTNCAFAQKAVANGADAILKNWKVPEITVQFYKSGNIYYAMAISGSDILEADGKTYKKDSQNPEPKLRNKSLKNFTHISGLTYKNGKWVDGKLYAFDNGSTYDLDLELKDDILYMRVYLGVRMLEKTFEFKPVN